jgi:hypothetical protein
MPVLVLLTVIVVGSVVFLGYQIKILRRQKRNLRHWERGEPLEDNGDWD